jgi:uncharacterized cupredoxin-like copper-binding protein
MNRWLARLLSASLVAGLFAFGAAVAQAGTIVKVALLDASAMSHGAPQAQPVGPYGAMMNSGYGMMGGNGMMGGTMMGMMAVRVDQTSFKAGAVSLDVTNWSRSVVHEVIVVAVDSPDAPLPYDYNTMRVPEDQVKVVGDSGELAPNASKMLDLTLTPGSCLLLCNVPGHYAAGMSVPISITP